MRASRGGELLVWLEGLGRNAQHHSKRLARKVTSMNVSTGQRWAWESHRRAPQAIAALVVAMPTPMLSMTSWGSRRRFDKSAAHKTRFMIAAPKFQIWLA